MTKLRKYIKENILGIANTTDERLEGLSRVSKGWAISTIFTPYLLMTASLSTGWAVEYGVYLIVGLISMVGGAYQLKNASLNLQEKHQQVILVEGYNLNWISLTLSYTLFFFLSLQSGQPFGLELGLGAIGASLLLVKPAMDAFNGKFCHPLLLLFGFRFYRVFINDSREGVVITRRSVEELYRSEWRQEASSKTWLIG